MVSNDVPSAPRRRISLSSSSAKSRSVGRCLRRGSTEARASIRDRRGGGDARDLTFVLHLALAVDETFRGYELGIREPLPCESPLLRPRDAVRLDREPSHGRCLRRERIALGGERETDRDLGIDPCVTELLPRLFAVTTVGDEEHVVGQDEQHRRRAGEAGHPADVDEAGHEERIAPVGATAVRTRSARGAPIHRGQCAHDDAFSRSDATACAASR